jgi:hypothetical protein
VTAAIRDKVYRTYLDFLETAESKRRWNIFNDIPWGKLDVSKITESTAQCVEIFCFEELYVPDYSSKGLEAGIFSKAWKLPYETPRRMACSSDPPIHIAADSPLGLVGYPFL